MDKPTECVKVAIRCRPISTKESGDGRKEIVTVNPSKNEIVVKNPNNISDKPILYTFDYTFNNTNTQEDIYNKCSKPIIDYLFEGYNGTIFAYGQTGTGKTYTMDGVQTNNNEGIIPRAVNYIFDTISKSSETTYLVRTSMIELYNEKIKDSLSKKKDEYLEIHNNPQKGFYVKGLEIFTVNSAKQLMELLNFGKSTRAVRATSKNDYSSRSHSIFSIIIESSSMGVDGKNHVKMGKLNLVDLAGSEKQKQTNTEGEGQKEGININLSLTNLGIVINKLVTNSPHIPYRNSKLTKLLEDSLGGNTKTVMIANTGPCDCDYAETIQTLKYANRAKSIKNKPIINQDPKDALLLEKQKELDLLRQQIELLSHGNIEEITRQLSLNPDARLDLNEPTTNTDTTKDNEDLEILNKENKKIIQEKNKLESELKKKRDLIEKERQYADKLLGKFNELKSEIIGKTEFEEINTKLKQAKDHLEEEEKSMKENTKEYKETKKLLQEKRMELGTMFDKTKNINDVIISLNNEIEAMEKEIGNIKKKKKKIEENNKKVISDINAKIQLLSSKFKFQNYVISKYVPNNFVKNIENVFYKENESKELNEIHLEPYSMNDIKRNISLEQGGHTEYYINPYILDINMRFKLNDFPKDEDLLGDSEDTFTDSKLNLFYFYDNVNNKLIRTDNNKEENISDYI